MTEDKGRILLSLARSAISDALGQSLDGFVPHQEDWLQEKGACFVTLKMNGKLRGCIGSLEASRPLFEDVHANAVAAALHDPRFPPLTIDELAKVNIEISLLSPMQKLDVQSEEETIARLRPGEDGVVFQYGNRKATFLPQVWEQLPDAHHFLAQLRIKAGLSPDFWHPDVLIYTYTVEKFSEGNLE
ncbi:MAG: hypothetical protein BMS9Abin18_1241 [Zetaproteobacteria bacterium]|nr:MAG: hypothetical protein BMS9Abin18_1241 [Zetaproteobacteria bacterium]